MVNYNFVAGAVASVAVIAGVFWFRVNRRTKRGNIPETMKAARLVKFVEDMKAGPALAKNFELATLPVPVPKPGQVLVRMECSPINPSDLSSLQGTYNSAQREALPAQMGFEGSGTAVQSGGGIGGWFVNGKRVAVISKAGGRMWAEYAIVPAFQCVPLPSNVSFEEGCSVFVNPLTVAAFVEIAKQGKHKAILHTAAASALGKMLVRYAQRNGVEVVNVVRRPEQKEALEAIGARHVVDTSDAKWEAKLAEECKATECTLGFDAVAGELTGNVLKAMPSNAILHVYGGLSMQAVSNVRPTDLLFAGKQLKGFWLTAYLKTKSLMGQKRMIDNVTARLKDDFKTDIAQRFPLDKISDAVQYYVKNMSAGKVCITCH
jgi:NADPH:quinone reductase-like Zn-dependent oxidoreductase